MRFITYFWWFFLFVENSNSAPIANFNELKNKIFGLEWRWEIITDILSHKCYLLRNRTHWHFLFLSSVLFWFKFKFDWKRNSWAKSTERNMKNFAACLAGSDFRTANQSSVILNSELSSWLSAHSVIISKSLTRRGSKSILFKPFSNLRFKQCLITTFSQTHRDFKTYISIAPAPGKNKPTWFSLLLYFPSLISKSDQEVIHKGFANWGDKCEKTFLAAATV